MRFLFSFESIQKNEIILTSHFDALKNHELMGKTYLQVAERCAAHTLFLGSVAMRDHAPQRCPLNMRAAL